MKIMPEKCTIDVLSNFTYIHFILDPSYEDIQEILGILVEKEINEKKIIRFY